MADQNDQPIGVGYYFALSYCLAASFNANTSSILRQVRTDRRLAIATTIIWLRHRCCQLSKVWIISRDVDPYCHDPADRESLLYYSLTISQQE